MESVSEYIQHIENSLSSDMTHCKTKYINRNKHIYNIDKGSKFSDW